MDLAAIRNRLSGAGGPAYWRRLEELTGDAEFRDWLKREAPRLEPIAWDTLSRREFLVLAAASLALAGVAGCGVQPPPEKILPYVRAPEELIPGKPLFYATAATLQGIATGVLVESHEGRPTKIEGNPQHPGSLGAVDPFTQASILTLYDPDRSQNVRFRGVIGTWERAAWELGRAAAKAGKGPDAGLCLLTQPVGSPTLAWQIRSLLEQFPQARWYQYEPVSRDAARQGAFLAFGREVEPLYRLDQAEVILALDADFLTAGPGHLCYAREFAAKRRGQPGPQNQTRVAGNRLYAVECMPTPTGAKADHRWSLPAGRMAQFARNLAARLDPSLRSAVGEVAAVSAPMDQQRLAALAGDLLAHRGQSLVVAGQQQPPAVHLLAHAMNHALGNAGPTVVYIDPPEVAPKNQMASLAELVEQMRSGRVRMLVILGGNPAFDAPADLQFAQHVAKVPLSVHLGMYQDETAAVCQWHLPEAHCLESWSDARAYDGTASIVQPLISPLFGGISAHEVVGALAGSPGRTSFDLVRQYWQEAWQREHAPQAGKSAAGPAAPDRDAAFEAFWRRALHDGVVPATTFPPREVALQADWAKGLSGANGMAAAAGQQAGHTLELVFRPDPTIFDGRFANNGWLQELPKPLSKLTWDNAALMSPGTAQKFGFTFAVSPYGGERGGAEAELADLEYRGRRLRVPVWVLPGVADDSVTLTLGYGRTAAGRVGSGVGANAYALRTSAAPWFDGGLVVRKAPGRYRLACTQYHHGMEGRQQVHVISPSGRQGEPNSSAQPEAAGEGPAAARHAEQLPSIYPQYPYEGYKWGMVIDLAACVGCGACVLACQAENNSPVVGKDQVYRGREMHWLRLDRYDAGERDDLQSYFQPVPCMQCENAPCELVCPVEATVHSDEGLNDMVYNRCVGTRYCSHNCPYKVRRFNFFQFADYKTTTLKMLRNPEVTVRSRGVMEKCTYCVQRISAARIAAAKADRRVRDGEVLTACQAACPAQAIAFGDLNDPQAAVARWKADARNYLLLGELNTRPRTSYLAVLRNPNEPSREIEAT
jgi:molybdopterin-containing oxidoreductase family iron-sulfur binding subunit